MVRRDSINDNPVSEAPTTTILLLLETLTEDNCFLVSIANENGGSDWSNGSLVASYPSYLPLLSICSGSSSKSHFLFNK